MTPSLLKQYLQEHGQASLRDLVLHFDVSAEALKDAISIWIRKGKVEQSSVSGCDKGCCQCDAELMTVYYWKN